MKSNNILKIKSLREEGGGCHFLDLVRSAGCCVVEELAVGTVSGRGITKCPRPGASLPRLKMTPPLGMPGPGLA